MSPESVNALLEPHRMALERDSVRTLADYAGDAKNEHIPFTFYLICQSLSRTNGGSLVSGQISGEIKALLTTRDLSPLGGWNPLGQFNRAWSNKNKHWNPDYSLILDRRRSESGNEQSPWELYFRPEYRDTVLDYFRGRKETQGTQSVERPGAAISSGSGDKKKVEEMDSVSEKLLSGLGREIFQGKVFVLDVDDRRNRVATAIVLRRGQQGFRDALIHAYEGKCAITGCDCIAALEAAHIYPYRGEHTNHVSNGLLLRADIHVLFDLDLIGIEPESRRIEIARNLRGTSYNDLRGRRLRRARKAGSEPIRFAPYPESLVWRWQRFHQPLSS